MSVQWSLEVSSVARAATCEGGQWVGGDEGVSILLDLSEGGSGIKQRGNSLQTEEAR